jgi:acetyl esterase/lipase
VSGNSTPANKRFNGESMQRQEIQGDDLNVASSRFSGRRCILIALALIVACCLSASSAQETNSKPQPAAASAAAPRVISIWPGVAPGSEQWKQKETTIHMGPMASTVNVTSPTLTAYLPDPAKATGTAVIIASGGGFLFLGSEKDVAEWLAARGIAAFDLKYRTAPLEGENEAQLGQSGRARFAAQLANHSLILEDGKYGIADGIQAIKVLREHSAELGISPDRIVFMGFSAGGMITEYAAVNPDTSTRPNYAAPIYGAPFPDVPPIPKGVPPVFMEMAQDDNLAGPQIVAFYDALKAAGYKPEFHIYEHGGHGWSMRRQGTTSDHWLEEFYWWLESHGLTTPGK